MNRTNSDTAYEILRLLQEEMMTAYPAFPEAFGQLDFVPCPKLNYAFGTDGLHLFYHPDLLNRDFLNDSAKLKRCYLHVYIHCLCFHMIQKHSVCTASQNAADAPPATLREAAYDLSARLWDTACDLSAELLAAQLDLTSESKQFLQNVSLLLGSSGWLTPEQILSIINNDPSLRSTPEFVRLTEQCTRDSHQFWLRVLISPDSMTIGGDADCRGNGNGSARLSPEHLSHLEALQNIWKDKLPKVHNTAHSGHRHGHAGTTTEDADLKQREEMDYRKFLRQFAIPREEALLDMDSFDYIPYHYGLEYYSNMPFIEPLEYKEVNRLDELAIAIDTSGSCSGKIVRRFLEETWNILRQRENFFAKMRLHLIQCDCMVQEHRIFTGVEEWEESISNLQIHGHGNTDFCPVFDYLEKQIRRKEIRHLRGLLYFTDGDGIFPSMPPSWDTAFVFLNDRTEKQAVPDWAIRLNLHLPDEFFTT